MEFSNRKRSVYILFYLLVFPWFLSPLLARPGGDLTVSLDSTGKHYIKASILGQVWTRYTQLNPGSTVDGIPKDGIWDIGIRRLRLTAWGQVTDHVFFYTQFGQNNFNPLSPKFTGAFFHDALIEFRAHPRALSIGGGLSGWSGLSRCASCSIGSILSLDIPIYQQATNSISDQFLRKLSLYAKGKLGKLDYRIALARPMSISGNNSLGPVSTFSPIPPSPQIQGYFKYDFCEVESNLTPYLKGSYLGQKKVFNIGLGAVYQPNAMWRSEGIGDTTFSPLLLLGVDAFLDLPFNEATHTNLTLYSALNYYDMGTNYLRNIGVMNPANGVNVNGTINGSGNAFPMIGSGTSAYFQAGYKFKDGLLPNNGTLQPYIASQISSFQALSEPMVMVEGGINWLIYGTHQAKMSLNLQNRPVFEYNSLGAGVQTSRKNMLQLQYQVSI